jgi:DNA mismatch repair ATPase MutS
MNVFLMYPNQDFGSEQKLMSDEVTLRQDLELDTLFGAMAQGDDFLFGVAQRAVLYSLDDLDVIFYRQEILKDCLKHPDVVIQIYNISVQCMINKREHWLSISSHYPGAILSAAIAMLEMFVGLLKTLKHIAGVHAEGFESQGFRRFFTMIQQEMDDEYIAVVSKYLKELRFRHGVSISAELGWANEGTNYILHQSNRNNPNWIQQVIGRKSPVYSYTLDPEDMAGARALGELRDKGVNLVANAVAQAADHIDRFFNVLRLELAFYVGCLNLSEQLSVLGEPIVFPQPAPANERQLSFTGLYDLNLALIMKQKVVSNDLNADHKDIVVITGANQGGKSTFLRSLGLAQLMMQCGMFVPAESFSANLCVGIFTHYKREEDISLESGKLDEELSRMNNIVDYLSPNSIVILNESFAATNEREGSEIARQVISALLFRHIKVYFVTHLYEFARGLYKQGMENAIFLRAERKDSGERTFKLTVGEPLPTSYGKDVYNVVFETQKSIACYPGR